MLVPKGTSGCTCWSRALRRCCQRWPDLQWLYIRGRRSGPRDSMPRQRLGLDQHLSRRAWCLSSVKADLLSRAWLTGAASLAEEREAPRFEPARLALRRSPTKVPGLRDFGARRGHADGFSRPTATSNTAGERARRLSDPVRSRAIAAETSGGRRFTGTPRGAMPGCWCRDRPVPPALPVPRQSATVDGRVVAARDADSVEVDRPQRPRSAGAPGHRRASALR